MSEVATRRVLVAEDESLIRMDIVETLREHGFEVIAEAGDGEEAIAKAEDLKPDLVVMDIKMPNMDGITAAKRMAELKIPVVLLTAFSQKELVEQAAEAGAMAYVVKPFTPTDLIPAVEIALSRHAQVLALESEVSDLIDRLETRKLVDRAKGLLIAKGLVKDEPEAFRWIQKTSMDGRLTMKDVGRTIIEQLSPSENS
jgi:response regulator NasT